MNTKKPLYVELAQLVQARANCIKSGNEEWRDRHEERIERLVADYMPSGSGFDNGTKVDLESCSATRLVFVTAFHHMNADGFYEGWTDHTVTIRPEFGDFSIRISGRDRRDIKDYIGDTFAECLRAEV